MLGWALLCCELLPAVCAAPAPAGGQRGYSCGDGWGGSEGEVTALRSRTAEAGLSWSC